MSGCRPTVAQVDLEVCCANLRAIRARVGRKDVWAVVKGDAYGHGAVQVARALARARVAGFGVATASEGRQLRRAGIELPILIMTGLVAGGSEDGFAIAAEYGLSVAVSEAETLAQLAAAAAVAAGPLSVHLKVDTGMGRIGALAAEAPALAHEAHRHPLISFDGVFSNLASADSGDAADPGHEFTLRQIELFAAVCEALREERLLPPHRTLANSAAIMHWPQSWEGELFTGVRPGLALYGASLTAGRDPVELRPAMRWVTAVQTVRELPRGVPVGYGMTFTTWRSTRVAVLPVGYHDGLPRALGNRGWVSIRDRRAPIIGRISMDTTLVDVTDVPAASSGDEVVLFGAPAEAAAAGLGQGTRASGYTATLAAALAAVGEIDADPALGRIDPGRGAINVEQVADWADTIPHEILSRVGGRVQRRYLPEGRGASGSREHG